MIDKLAYVIALAHEQHVGRAAQACGVTQPGVVSTTFHHAEVGANVVTTDDSDWATNCPEYKVTAVQVRKTNLVSDRRAKFTEEDGSPPASRRFGRRE